MTKPRVPEPMDYYGRYRKMIWRTDEAVAQLRISRRTFYRWVKKLGIRPRIEHRAIPRTKKRFNWWTNEDLWRIIEARTGFRELAKKAIKP